MLGTKAPISVWAFCGLKLKDKDKDKDNDNDNGNGKGLKCRKPGHTDKIKLPLH
jgi:hypothetical protein